MPSMELYSDAFILYCVVSYNWLTLQSILNILAGVFIVQVAFFARAIFVFAVATIAVSNESYFFQSEHVPSSRILKACQYKDCATICTKVCKVSVALGVPLIDCLSEYLQDFQ